MLFKLALRNIRVSIRDYTIYFVTLLFGVAVFYAFNAISAQEVMFDIESRAQSNIFELTSYMMGIFSVVIACVLGFLILYSNGFLIRRRKKEFGTYMILGMSAGQTSRIMLIETFLVGIGALVVGLLLGFLISQALSFLTAALFGMTIKHYQFVFSSQAFLSTMLCFAVIFIVAALFNTGAVNRQKLIDLLRADSSNQKVTVRSPLLCFIGFLVSIAILAYAYQQLIESGLVMLDDPRFIRATVFMLIGTFVLFWSLSGFFIAVVTRSRRFYLRGLRPFTVRQVASRVNTAFFSLWAICVMLFFSITVFSCGIGLMDSLTGDINNANPYSASIHASVYTEKQGSTPAERSQAVAQETPEAYSRGQMAGWNIAEALYGSAPQLWDETVAASAQLTSYQAPDLTYGDLFEKLSPSTLEELQPAISSTTPAMQIQIIAASEVDRTLSMLGKDPVALASGQCAVMNNMSAMQRAAEELARSDMALTVAGYGLVIQEGVVDLQMQDFSVTSTGLVFAVPDEVIDSVRSQGIVPMACDLNLMYADNSMKDVENDQAVEQIIAASQAPASPDDPVEMNGEQVRYQTSNWPVSTVMYRDYLVSQAGGLRMLIVYLAVYVGLVFLIATGAVLAVQQLSTTADSLNRYKMLSRLGCSRRSISKSLFAQICIYFLLPLVVAVCHSTCAIAVLNKNMFSAFGTSVLMPIILAFVLVVVIYGGYLLVTYLTSRSIVNSQSA